MKTGRGRAATRGHGLTGYLAECLWPGVTDADVEAIDARARTVTSAGEQAARYRGALLVPKDDVVFFFFDAPAITAVRSATDHLKIPASRILETRRWRAATKT